MMTDVLVSLRDVCFSYAPDRPVLDACSFSLDPAERGREIAVVPGGGIPEIEHVA
jgi:hypothetical protein